MDSGSEKELIAREPNGAKAGEVMATKIMSPAEQAEDARRRMRAAAERLTVGHGRDVVKSTIQSTLRATAGSLPPKALPAVAVAAGVALTYFPKLRRLAKTAAMLYINRQIHKLPK
jgi:hypothetical protein